MNDKQTSQETILQSKHFDQDLERLRKLAEKIKRYTEEEEREKWQAQVNYGHS